MIMAPKSRTRKSSHRQQSIVEEPTAEVVVDPDVQIESAINILRTCENTKQQEAFFYRTASEMLSTLMLLKPIDREKYKMHLQTFMLAIPGGIGTIGPISPCSVKFLELMKAHRDDPDLMLIWLRRIKKSLLASACLPDELAELHSRFWLISPFLRDELVSLMLEHSLAPNGRKIMVYGVLAILADTVIPVTTVKTVMAKEAFNQIRSLWVNDTRDFRIAILAAFKACLFPNHRPIVMPTEADNDKVKETTMTSSFHEEMTWVCARVIHFLSIDCVNNTVALTTTPILSSSPTDTDKMIGALFFQLLDKYSHCSRVSHALCTAILFLLDISSPLTSSVVLSAFRAAKGDTTAASTVSASITALFNTLSSHKTDAKLVKTLCQIMIRLIVANPTHIGVSFVKCIEDTTEGECLDDAECYGSLLIDRLTVHMKDKEVMALLIRCISLVCEISTQIPSKLAALPHCTVIHRILAKIIPNQAIYGYEVIIQVWEYYLLTEYDEDVLSDIIAILSDTKHHSIWLASRHYLIVLIKTIHRYMITDDIPMIAMVLEWFVAGIEHMQTLSAREHYDHRITGYDLTTLLDTLQAIENRYKLTLPGVTNIVSEEDRLSVALVALSQKIRGMLQDSDKKNLYGQPVINGTPSILPI